MVVSPQIVFTSISAAFTSAVRATHIPDRQDSELVESMRDFERGEEALTEGWRTWRMCLDNSRENNRHFDRVRARALKRWIGPHHPLLLMLHHLSPPITDCKHRQQEMPLLQAG